MRDFILKLRILRAFLSSALNDWVQGVWRVDLDAQYCCDGRQCCCGGDTWRGLYEASAKAIRK